ncbi:UNVERIFIED_CONTAM: KIN14B-interacting protein [Sesamum radiatum]|uniref:KIN14B-interacting protein n=1 Tax=Sesamum radiatum TaxID=300843 RepID=A0AAW2QGB2_SESRA
MSTSSVRRIKERGGGGAKIAAAPTGRISPGSGKSISTGKENPRPTSRVRAATQKPNIMPMARIDKSAAAQAVEEPRSRWSTSSVPRGRSSSPSEFTRVLSDLRKNSSRVSLGPPQSKVSGVGSKCLNEKSGKTCVLEKRVLKDLWKKGSTFELNFGRKRESENEKSSLESDLESNKFSEEVTIESHKVGLLMSLSSRESKTVNKASDLPGVLRENVPSKYSSKLQEKLAFLEGKVKRIASDINRTKEMLDMNNPDASKMILYDIQEKITGIEKAMGHIVGSDGDTKMGFVKDGENQDEKETKKVTDAKSLIKGLTLEELEERLFPHHKLMRDRILSKKTSGDYQTNLLKVGESTSMFNIDEEKVSSVGDETIALEFLASLSKEEFGSESSKIHEMDDYETSDAESSLNVLNDRGNIDALLMAAEKLNEFDDQEGVPAMTFEEEEEEEENYTLKLNDIGSKTSTGGWFVSEGKSVLLAHDDGSCSFYDIVNSEEKAEYKPPAGFLPNMWRDCWIICAPGADGCSGKYVVAASAGNSVDSGFCSWDFYTKDIHACHFENETTHLRTAVPPLPNKSVATENREWWYKPCGPLIISSASCQNRVQIYDIRDGEQIMKWELQKPVLAMDYSSPLHWRNRGKVVIAESDAISLWDVSSLSSRALLHPSGIGLKISKVGVNADSAFSRGDSIYIGCSSLMSSGKKQCSSQIQQFSLRKQRLLCTYALPESHASNNLTALTQVWGNASLVMGVLWLGLFVFDSLTDDRLPFLSMNYGHTQNVKEVIGPDDMYCPSFDYMASRILIISKDRPARWRYLM